MLFDILAAGECPSVGKLRDKLGVGWSNGRVLSFISSFIILVMVAGLKFDKSGGLCSPLLFLWSLFAVRGPVVLR